ncbi:Fatty acid hydroxylase domain-containing protein 2 [Halocaridina rubra]|uniref:Fatty acid hydroxylase domain-containing protein 2 n=1 Tax=Halocaridina rubra TaxID=373956 RepID=A0AAN8WJ82_HALRR
MSYLQHFWGASGNIWQQQWDKVLAIESNDRILYVYGTILIFGTTYWCLGGLYTFMDVTNFPKFLRKYKVQPGINEPVDTWNLLKCIFWVTFNFTVVSAPALEAGYFLMQLRGYEASSQLPAFPKVIFQLVICVLVQEVAFYYFHRLFHHRRLYKYIHKMHHEWQSPISITAAYCHPAEHLVVNLTPLFLGPLIVGMHVAGFWLWGVIGVLQTLNSHSGYHLPFLFSPEAHDYHHLKFDQNYGTLGLLDFLHGTNAKFRNAVQFERHITLTNLRSARELFPDDSDKSKVIKEE